WSGGFWQWTMDTTPVASVDTGTRKITLSTMPKFDTWNTVSAPPSGSRYFVQGDLSMLDSAGEFFYDRNNSNGSPGTGFHYLYYYPRNTPIASQTIVVPTTQNLISFVGTNGTTRCKNITVDGLALKNTDFGQTYC